MKFKILYLEDILSLDKESFVESAQFNYMHDIEWLVDKYPKENQDKPLTIVNGNPFGEEYKQFSEVYPQLKFIRVRFRSKCRMTLMLWQFYRPDSKHTELIILK